MPETRNDEPNLLEVLRSGPVGVTSPQEMERKRAQMLPWLEEQVEQMPRARQAHRTKLRARRRMIFGAVSVSFGVAAAAIFALASSVRWNPTSSEVQLQQVVRQQPQNESRQEMAFATLISGELESGPADLLSGSRFSRDSRVSTSRENTARVKDSSGFEVTLAPDSEFSFDSTKQKSTSQDRFVSLFKGSAQFVVPHLEDGKTLSVITPSAHVTVIGTEFSVTVGKDGATTCVRVSRGKVLVVAAGEQRFLSAGESRGCEEPRSAPVPPIKSHMGSVETRTTLAEQNALLSTALAQERRGNLSAAKNAFERLMRSYPDSPFLPEARAGLARVRTAESKQ